MSLVDRMIQFRALNNLSQAEFGKLCKMDQSYISNVENGKAIPSKVTRARIELVLAGKEIKAKEG